MVSEEEVRAVAQAFADALDRGDFESVATTLDARAYLWLRSHDGIVHL